MNGATTPETSTYKSTLQKHLKDYNSRLKTQHVEPYAFDSTDSDF